MKPTTPLLFAALMLAALSGCASRQEDPPSAAPGGQARPQLSARYTNARSQSMAESITHKWKRTPEMDKNARALVKMEITTDGDVIAAEITESDGDAAFNESVIQAVYRTSPLPLPEDSRFFDPNIDVCMSQNRRSCR